MVSPSKSGTVKFLCSYGGKILPRYPDGKLRYHGGHTRVLAVNRSVSFSELTSKMAEMCGSPVILRFQLPNEDLDALVSVTSDEDLANLIEEYDRVSSAAAPEKIRAFLYPTRLPAGKSNVSTPPTKATATEPSSSSLSSSSSSSSSSPRLSAKPPLPPSPPIVAARNPYYGCYVHRKPSHIYLVHNGNHWQ